MGDDILNNPRMRALGIMVAVVGAALWIDHESYKGVQQGIAMRREREERNRERLEMENRFIRVSDISHLPRMHPWRVDWPKDIVFVEAYGNIYYTFGGRYVYEWYRGQYSNWYQYVILDRFPEWRRYSRI